MGLSRITAAPSTEHWCRRPGYFGSGRGFYHRSQPASFKWSEVSEPINRPIKTYPDQPGRVHVTNGRCPLSHEPAPRPPASAPPCSGTTRLIFPAAIILTAAATSRFRLMASFESSIQPGARPGRSPTSVSVLVRAAGGWGADGTVLFATRRTIQMVSASGSTARASDWMRSPRPPPHQSRADESDAGHWREPRPRRSGIWIGDLDRRVFTRLTSRGLHPVPHPTIGRSFSRPSTRPASAICICSIYRASLRAVVPAYG